jgi:hypothetical protein
VAWETPRSMIKGPPPVPEVKVNALTVQVVEK